MPSTGWDVVTFDYWNTLVREARPGALVDARLPSMRDELAALGVEVSANDLRRAHGVAQREFEAASGSGILYETIEASTAMASALGLPNVAIAALNVGFVVGSASSEVCLVDGARELVMSLHDADVRLAIVCDVGLTPSSVLVDWMRQWHLLEFFDAVAFSDRLGAYKPDTLMFDHVMTALDCPSRDRAVHIGDRRRTDVQGARAAGLASVRFNGVFDDESDLPEADYVVPTMLQLRTLLLES
jgi:FMN phosphatase YigB (HAD superfamily)